MRKPLIAANWKMYKNPTESTAFLTHFAPLIKHHDKAEIVLCPSMTSLPALVDAARGKSIFVGAQTMHWLNEGAYTGETSPTMLTAIGATHVLIGHSERRQYFNETDTTVNLKLKAALAHGLIPIVCVGEHLTEREAGLTANVLELQTSLALEGVDPAAAAPIVFAYEPVWAIGTGRTATPEIAADAHKIIRAQIAKSLTPELAASIRILYGGSVKPDNAQSLCCLEDIDGALVGGASLDPTSFAQIVTNATN
ncbi:triosephosphate isomerase [Edaphobacter aggregans]|uniref:Triosephosphate isomerase n=1 Tax=Edaphobacter aggregans TaxID=570835 RepID=A0A3R9P7N4_9BACT|nr:triose-phosphate isomerase [Edaphobacter aggregans]RSL15331.1 triosephosphate isomerase [Edaphobacter aggregans]